MCQYSSKWLAAIMYFILNSKTFAIVLISSNKRFFVWCYDQFGNLPHHFVWTIRVPSGHILVDSPSIRRRNSTWKVRRNDINFEGGIHMEIMTSIRRENFDLDSTFKIDEILMSFPRGFFNIVLTSNGRNFCTRCFHCIIS